MTSVVLNDASVEYSKFEALLDLENQELLQEFKNLYAHELQDGANISVLTFLLKKAVQHKKKKLGLVDDLKKNNRSTNAPLPMSPKVSSLPNADVEKNGPKFVPRRKPLPASVRKIIWQKAKACCEYTDIKRGIRCQSRFALEPDHIIPLALGGTDDVNNLQLLCRAHNSRRAIQTFGIYQK